MADKNHRSHIGGKRNKACGWRAIPPQHSRETTKKLFRDWQITNCKGCQFAVGQLIGTGQLCCTWVGSLKMTPDGRCMIRPQ